MDGYANVERSYDKEGRLVSVRYLDRYNRLTNNTDGVAGWSGKYNDEGELIITNCYDQKHNSVVPTVELDAYAA